jgi:hypothetical protein
MQGQGERIRMQGRVCGGGGDTGKVSEDLSVALVGDEQSSDEEERVNVLYLISLSPPLPLPLTVLETDPRDRLHRPLETCSDSRGFNDWGVASRGGGGGRVTVCNYMPL